MTPIALFETVWERCGHLSAMHAYLANNVAGALKPEELLRAEWAARVSAVDLYVHELVAQGMLATFEGLRPTTLGYLRFRISNETLDRIGKAASASDASAAFDLEVREQLSRLTFQNPEDIADGIKLFSPVELWNEIAIHLGQPPKTLKTELSLIIRRRHKIVHEADLQPTAPRWPWAISQGDLTAIAAFLEKIARAIDVVV